MSPPVALPLANLLRCSMRMVASQLAVSVVSVGRSDRLTIRQQLLITPFVPRTVHLQQSRASDKALLANITFLGLWLTLVPSASASAVPFGCQCNNNTLRKSPVAAKEERKNRVSVHSNSDRDCGCLKFRVHCLWPRNEDCVGCGMIARQMNQEWD